MKKKIGFGIIFVLLLTMSIGFAGNINHGTIMGDDVNFRNFPSLNSGVFGSLYSGEKVYVYSIHSDPNSNQKFYKLFSSRFNCTGFVATDYVILESW